MYCTNSCTYSWAVLLVCIKLASKYILQMTIYIAFDGYSDLNMVVNHTVCPRLMSKAGLNVGEGSFVSLNSIQSEFQHHFKRIWFQMSKKSYSIKSYHYCSGKTSFVPLKMEEYFKNKCQLSYILSSLLNNDSKRLAFSFLIFMRSDLMR